MSGTNTCPCGSKSEIEVCCLPIIRGKREAETAEELLRARYSAFTLGEVPFILSTHHSKTRSEVSESEIEDWAKNSKWLGLNIVQIEGGSKTDDKGSLVFSAHYEADGKKNEHWEKSLFERENGAWRFLDAQKVQIGTFRRAEPKLGRNDPCPCKSGKKFKKCCAQTQSA